MTADLFVTNARVVKPDAIVECGIAVRDGVVSALVAAGETVAARSTVDAEGCVWNALVIGGDLIRYAPDGSVERRIGMPVKNITSVTFGGADLDEIYVTSMARVSHPATHEHFARQVKPQFGAGSLFRIRGLGIRGLPEPRFAG